MHSNLRQSCFVLAALLGLFFLFGTSAALMDPEEAYQLLFSEQSEPLTPGKALKHLIDMSNSLRDPIKLEQVKDLVKLNERSDYCLLSEISMSIKAMDAHEQHPAIKPYLKYCRQELFESCYAEMVVSFAEFKRNPNRSSNSKEQDSFKALIGGAYKGPVVVDGFYELTDVKKALIKWMEYKLGSSISREFEPFRVQFIDTVSTMCSTLPERMKLTADEIKLFFTDEELMKKLEPAYLDWIKTMEVCENIRVDPTKSIRAVYEQL